MRLALILCILYFIVRYVVTGIPMYAVEAFPVYGLFLLRASLAEHRNCRAFFFIVKVSQR